MSVSRIIAAAAAALSILALPAAARADVSLSNVVAHPITAGATCDAAVAVDAPAASHRDLCVSFDVNQTNNDDLEGLTIHLAPGLLGNPTAAARCSQADFSAGGCSSDTQVGAVATTATAAGLPLPLSLTGEVYNLVPNADEPARLGISIEPAGGLASAIRIQTSIRTRLTDYGLDSITRDPIPRTATLLATVPITVTHMALTLWGPMSAHPTLAKPFVTVPTSCRPATTTIDATAYDGSATGGSDTFTPTDCAHVPFTPSLVVGPKQSPADTPGEATATLVVPAATGDDRVQANVKRVELALPKGLVLSAGLANGLTACTEEQFGLKEDRPPQCPASSEIGDVQFVTPLIGTLTGKVYFGTPTPTAKLRNFVSVEDPRLRVKLIGDVTVDPQTGQVTNVFPDSPQVPFTEFRSRYNGGPDAVLSSPSACGTYTAVATMTPYSGGPAASPSDSADVVDCPPPAFTPSLGISSSDPTAGAPTAVTVRIDRPDRQVRLLRSEISLPPGLVGRLASVPLCPVDAARAAGCAEASRVGSARVVVGNGTDPLALGASVYLTQGFGGGIAGLAIVVPAKVGPIDLGTVVTMAKLTLRPDGGIDVQTEDLPQIVGGIPTPYRTIELTIDRPGFLINPTSCAALPAHGAFTGAGGEQATADTTYQPSGCDRLPYAPRLAVTMGGPGQVATGTHPQLTTILTQAPSEANSRHVEVTLPARIGADVNALTRACPVDRLEAGTCPPSAVVGSVRADTPLLAAPLQGPVLIVKTGLLPELSLELRGPIDLRLRATVGFAAHARLKTIFDGIPDVPLSRLALTFTGGKTGIISAGRNLCGPPKLRVDASFESQAGSKRTAVVTPAIPGCRPQATATLTGVRGARPRLRLKVTSGTDALRQLTVSLPKALRAVPSALRRGAKAIAGGNRVRSAKVRVSRGRIVVSGLPKAGAGSVEVSLGPGTLRRTRRIAPNTRLTFTIWSRDVTGAAAVTTAVARAKR